ncbi:double-strand break repair protein AddB [Pseudooceanicola sp. C21-150M6]|uniref:double-strand break repair protein AddB n=1 Tax=Pseudooceanicola sp. C21-150M6 TaxID=3434355 RepID=UPI003D7F2BBC
MFEPSDRPRVFGLPPGVDFPQLLVDGILARMAGQPPEALGRVQLIVNTRRMQRRVRAIFDAGPALLMPRIHLLAEFGETFAPGRIPASVSALRRRLSLIQLVQALLDREPGLAPRAALYDLADSLAGIFDEMRGEGVSPEGLNGLDVSSHSDHWARALKFLSIVQQVDAQDEGPDPSARLRMVAEFLQEAWREAPLQDPVIVAGSTGSRGATNLLMQAVARLPQGALILPGFDFDLPETVWEDHLEDTLTAEDHPQYRFRSLTRDLGLRKSDVTAWQVSAENQSRNRLVSLALRPAPVTDQWLSEGPLLDDLDRAMADVTLLEAPSPREEAQAIALRLRLAAETGQKAALITPDSTLARQVKSALDRWAIIPDDSLGEPLHLTAPGRFLRQIMSLFHRKMGAEVLLALLKHPLCHAGGDRNQHLMLTRSLELKLRRHGPPFPDAQVIRDFAATQRQEIAGDWAEWIVDHILTLPMPEPVLLAEGLERLLTHADRLCAGCRAEAGPLYEEAAGQELARAIEELTGAADAGGIMAAPDLDNLLTAVLRGREARDSAAPHPDILIWGTLEARVQGADLVILAGLNEGVWPEAPTPDPWLNRQMRSDLGLLLPERKIGLSAHDFQQAVGAREVWLSRAMRGSEAETVASRWLNRLTNLLNGLGDAGRSELAAARARGAYWLGLVQALEAVEPVTPAPRPAPVPPVEARPRKLSVTRIKTLIRDPYAIYAREVLRLKPLDPLMKAPDALMRGIAVHEVMESFVREVTADRTRLSVDRLMALTQAVLEDNVPWAEARLLWLARMARAADAVVEGEVARQLAGQPAKYEVEGGTSLTGIDFRLTAQADRIDIDARGNALIYDYKTGTMSSAKQQKAFDLQLLLEAAMVERGAFEGIDPRHTVRAAFIGLGGNTKEVDAPLEEMPTEEVWARFSTLIQQYFDPDQAYVARRALFRVEDISDYDHLARHGEWDITQAARRVVLR